MPSLQYGRIVFLGTAQPQDLVEWVFCALFFGFS